MTPIFDTHAHYDDASFDEDREEVLRSLSENGVAKAVDVGAGILSSQKALELAGSHDFLYCALGVHPDEVGDLNEETCSWLEKTAAEEDKCVAIGETGLDYHWDVHSHEEQKKWFEWQIELAKRIGKPLIIHSRDAAKDTYDVMKACRAGEAGGVVHCYSYSAEMARDFLDMGFYIGIGGVLTYKNARKLVETAQIVPLDRIVLETDCPYLSPVPHRGERNTSINIAYVAEKLAEIKNTDVEIVRKAVWENAHRLYGLRL